jgi:hypothetical protein
LFDEIVAQEASLGANPRTFSLDVTFLSPEYPVWIYQIGVQMNFDLEFCGTWPWQSPAGTIAWVLGKFVNDLPPNKKMKMLTMTVSDLIEQAQMGTF